MSADFQSLLKNAFEAASHETNLWDQIHFYYDLGAEIERLIKKVERQRMNTADSQNVQLLYYTLRDRAELGESVLTAIVETYPEGEETPSVLRSIAEGIQINIGSDTALQKALLEKFPDVTFVPR